MRPIKFRGRATCSDRWAYGCYVECDGGYYIVEKLGGDEGNTRKTQVDPKTVGQFTGLKDKNGKEIYEGDIVKLDTPQSLYHKSRNLAVIFNQKFAQFCIEPCTAFMGWPSIEVIGNIHENPKLIEEKE